MDNKIVISGGVTLGFKIFWGMILGYLSLMAVIGVVAFVVAIVVAIAGGGQ